MTKTILGLGKYTPTNLLLLTSHISTQTDCSWHTHHTFTHINKHTHIHIHGCNVPKLAGRRGQSWSECHGWVSPKKIGTPRRDTGGLKLLLCVASCLSRMGFNAAQRHVAQRGQTSAVGRVPRQSSFTSPFQWLEQTEVVTLPLMWEHQAGTLYLYIPPSIPPETSSLSHADEPEDHPCSITVHSHWAKGPHTHTDSGLYTHSLSWCVRPHKSRHTQPTSLSGELIIMAMKREGREDWEMED